MSKEPERITLSANIMHLKEKKKTKPLTVDQTILTLQMWEEKSARESISKMKASTHSTDSQTLWE